jgi:cytochrome oxidase Cu insertion factor (SCO1/SenC/PrrC family)
MLLLVFALPSVSAWFFYLNPQYMPSGRSNQGELIQPSIPFPGDIELRQLDGLAFNSDSLAGKWTMLALYAKGCDDNCQARMTDLQQIRLALGESSLAVERLLVLKDAPPAEELQQLSRRFQGMQIAITSDQLTTLNPDPLDADNRIYLLDPMGQLMMRYAQNAPAKAILKDMERLMKASKNWIKGAQYGHR